MASDLERLCLSLGSTLAGTRPIASSLAQRAGELRQASQAAARVASDSTRPGGRDSAIALEQAAGACARAASLLDSAVRAGERYIAQTIGATTSGGSDGGRPIGSPDERAVAALTQLARIVAGLGEINATGDAFTPKAGQNCGSCALAVMRRLSGQDRTASTTSHGTVQLHEMALAIGASQTAMDPAEIAAALVAAGPGSHAVVGIDRLNGAGHWFNAFYDGTTVVTLDGQSGEVGDWPPDYGSTTHPVIHWDAAVFDAPPRSRSDP